jgi:hypothetical protein
MSRKFLQRSLNHTAPQLLWRHLLSAVRRAVYCTISSRPRACPPACKECENC